MYQPGIGYQFSQEERAVFDEAVADFAQAVGSESTGTKQNCLIALLRACQPAFSEGELRCAIRVFQEMAP